MKTSTARIALGVFVLTASLAASRAATAQTWARWQNASTPDSNPFFFGVSGGPICGGHGCTYNPNTQIIMWQLGQDDQDWLTTFPGGAQHVVNAHGDIVSGTGWCLHPSGSTNNSNLVIDPCTTSSIDNWIITKGSDLTQPATGNLANCYVFQNQLSFRVLSVYQGRVFNGAHVVEYDFCQPGSNVCGSPAGYHADQFWCPRNP
jgi:hypothetical protein